MFSKKQQKDVRLDCRDGTKLHSDVKVAGFKLSYLRVQLRRCHWALPGLPLLHKHRNSLRLLRLRKQRNAKLSAISWLVVWKCDSRRGNTLRGTV